MRRPLLVGLLLLVLLGVAGRWLLAPGRGINQATSELIVAGMSLQDVEALLGAPPGDYRTEDVQPNPERMWKFHNVHTSMDVLLGKRRFRHEWWNGNEGLLWVCFDENDLVVDTEFAPIIDAGLWQRLRRWVGL